MSRIVSMKTVDPAGEKGSYWDLIGRPLVEYNTNILRETFLGDYFTTGFVDKMRNDSMIASILNAVILPIINAEHIIEPASSDPKDEEIAAFVRYCLFEQQNHSEKKYHDALSLVYGFMPYEYGRKFIKSHPEFGDDLSCITLNVRKPSTVDRWEKDGDLFKGFYQQTDIHDIWIPAERIQLVNYREEFGNIEGKSILREMYQAFTNKQKITIIGLMNLERLGGIPFIQGIHNWDSAKQAIEILKGIRSHENAFAAIPQQMGELKMLTGGAGASDHIAYLHYMDNQMAKSVLAQFINLGADSVSGSRAVGDVQMEFFKSSIQAIVRQFEDAYNLEKGNFPAYIKELVDLNYSGVTDYPKYKITKLSDEDVERVVGVLSAIATARTLSATDEIMVRERFNMITDEIREQLIEDKVEENDSDNSDTREIRGDQDGGKEDSQKEEEKEKKENFNLQPGDHGTVGDCCGHRHLHNISPVKLNREPRGLEKFVNFNALGGHLDSSTRVIADKIEDYTFGVLDKKLKKLKKDMESGNISGIRKFKFNEKERLEMLSDIEQDVKLTYDFGRRSVTEEIENQKDERDLLFVDGSDLIDELSNSSMAEMLALSSSAFFNSIEDAVKRDALAQVRTGEIDIPAIETSVTQKTSNDFKSLAFMLSVSALNQGREDQAGSMDDEIKFAEYSAIMDDNTCPDCAKKDGQRFQLNTRESQRLRVPNPQCFSTASKNSVNRCRCIWVFALRNEIDTA